KNEKGRKKKEENNTPSNGHLDPVSAATFILTKGKGRMNCAPFLATKMKTSFLGCRCASLLRSLWCFVAFPAHADDFGNAWLLHRYAVKNAARFHRLAIVRHDDELCLCAHLAN